MPNKIKTIKDFDAIDDINSIIESWASVSGFYDDIPSVRDFTDYHNIAYCLKGNDKDSSILLTINILDDKVHMETWAISGISMHSEQKQRINQLLEKLGQKPI